MGDEEGEPREKVVEEPPAPVEPPKPEIDPGELKAALETYLTNTLPDLVRRSISGLVDEAVTRALGGNEAEEQTTEGGENAAAAGEPNEAERSNPGGLDSMLFLSALASSHVDPDPTVPHHTPNGLHPTDADAPAQETNASGTSSDISSGTPETGKAENHQEENNKEVGKEPKRPRSSRRKADDNDSSPGGPRAEA
jgi:hypothetical protein